MAFKLFLAFVYDIVNCCMLFQWLILFLALYLTTYFIVLAKRQNVNFCGEILPGDNNGGNGKVHLIFLAIIIPHFVIFFIRVMCLKDEWNQTLETSPAMWILNNFYFGSSFKMFITFLTPITIIEVIMACYNEKISNFLHDQNNRSTAIGILITFAIVLLTASYFFGTSAQNAYNDFQERKLTLNTAYISRVFFIGTNNDL